MLKHKQKTLLFSSTRWKRMLRDYAICLLPCVLRLGNMISFHFPNAADGLSRSGSGIVSAFLSSILGSTNTGKQFSGEH